MKTLVLFAVAAIVTSPLFAQGDPRPPRGRQLSDLLDSLFAVEPHRATTRAEIDALLEPYASFAAPTGSERKKLLKEIQKAWEDGRELPKQKGEQWYEEEPQRGRYFISGRLRKPKGLFIGLHGGGAGSADASSAYASYKGAADARDWVSIYPQALEATEHGWTDSGTEEWILTLIEEARRTFDVPADRVYIGGHSMGGYGTWVLGAHHADLFAAGVASAGAPTPVRSRGSEQIVDIVDGVIPNLRNLPLCVFQSTDDPRVPPDVNQFAAEAVTKAKKSWGGYEHFDYWEVTDRGHGFPAEGVDGLLKRIEDFERDPHPERVTWQPALAWQSSFYWLDWPSPNRSATVDATIDRDANRIDVSVRGSAKGLAVHLSPSIVDMQKEIAVTLNGKEVFRGVPETSWATLVRTALHGDEGRLYEARIELAP